MRANELMRAAIVFLGVLLAAGLFFLSSGSRIKNYLKAELDETVEQMQQAIENNEIDRTTDTLNYDVYKYALTAAAQTLAPGEQIVHINVGFDSLDRGLKYINDTFGHLNGRPTIQAFANLLKEVFPQEKGWVLCHRGGSGFLVFNKGHFTEEILLDYYNTLKARWHDTPYQVPLEKDGKKVYVEGMALYFLSSVGPECGRTFTELRDILTYKKLSLRSITNCGYVIVMNPEHYISSVEIDESLFMEDK